MTARDEHGHFIKTAKAEEVAAGLADPEPAGVGDNSAGRIAGDRLKTFIDRITRLEEEKKALGADIKEVYAEAKGNGFDTKIMRQVIRILAMDKDDYDEQAELTEIYLRAVGVPL